MKRTVALLSLAILLFSGAQPASAAIVSSTTSTYSTSENIKTSRIVALPNGTKVMTWFEVGSPRTFKVMSAVVSALGSLSTPKVIQSFSVSSNLPFHVDSEITVSPKGRVTLAFVADIVDETSVIEHHLYATTTTNGLTWSQPVDVTPSYQPIRGDFIGFRAPKMTTNAAGTTVLAYWRSGLDQTDSLELVTSSDGLTWSSKREINVADQGGEFSPRLASAGNKVLVMFATNRPSRSLSYVLASNAQASDWSETGVIQAGVATLDFALAPWGDTFTAIWVGGGVRPSMYFSNLSKAPNLTWSPAQALPNAPFSNTRVNQSNIVVESGTKFRLIWMSYSTEDYMWSVTFTSGVPDVPYKHFYSIGKEGDPKAHFNLLTTSAKPGGGWYFITSRYSEPYDVWFGEVAQSGARTLTKLNFSLTNLVGLLPSSDGTITAHYLVDTVDGPRTLKIETIKNYTAPTLASALTVSGKYLVSKSMSVATPKWKSGGPITKVAYQWYTCQLAVTKIQSAIPAGCVAVRGATKQTFVPTKAQMFKFLTVVVTATNPAGSARVMALTKTRVK